MSIFTSELHFIARLRSPSGNEGDFPVLAWEMDDDGTGCAIVVMPDGVIARTDRLEHDNWAVLGIMPIRMVSGPRIEVPA